MAHADARDYATYFGYDDLNRLEWQKDALENPTYYTYDANGNQLTVKDALEHTAYFYYNELDRQKGSYQYLDGQKLETYFEFDENGNTTASVNARGHATYFGYDSLNRLEWQKDALDQSTYYTYDAVGNLLSTQDPLAHTTTSTYDDLNRTTCTTDPLAANTYFDYDRNGNLTEVIDAESHATYYIYDEVNRLTSMENALLQSETYTYDQNGNLAVSQDPDSRATYFTYDELDRQTCVEYPDGVTSYFVFDAVSDLSKAQDARGWTYFTYDELGRLVQEDAPDGAQTSHAWDAVGRRTRVTWPAGSTYYAYDAVNRMKHAQAENEAVGTCYYTYDAAGNVAKKVLGNGCFTYFTYDEVNRTTAILNCLPDGSPLAYFEYTYDPAGRITKCVREDASVVYYGYDDSDRLTGETWKDSGGGTIYAFEWDYDKVSNRTYQKGGSDETYYDYDAGNELTRLHELPDDQWTYFAYDPHGHGNCVRIQEPAGTTYFEYSDADLVTMIKYPNATVNYFWYDAQLGRYAMVDSGGLSYFTWDQNGMNLLAERDNAGTVTAEYTHGYTPIDGIGSAVAAEKTEGGATYYQYPVYDHRGTVVRLTDQTAAVTAYYEYNAWGQKLRDEVIHPAASNRFRYQSNWIELRDSGGVLFLSPTRVYNGALGRFLQRDRLQHRSGSNLYAAFDGIPAMAVDPAGLIPTFEDPLSPDCRPPPPTLAERALRGELTEAEVAKLRQDLSAYEKAVHYTLKSLRNVHYFCQCTMPLLLKQQRESFEEWAKDRWVFLAPAADPSRKYVRRMLYLMWSQTLDPSLRVRSDSNSRSSNMPEQSQQSSRALPRFKERWAVPPGLHWPVPWDLVVSGTLRGGQAGVQFGARGAEYASERTAGYLQETAQKGIQLRHARPGFLQRNQPTVQAYRQEAASLESLGRGIAYVGFAVQAGGWVGTSLEFAQAVRKDEDWLVQVGTGVRVVGEGIALGFSVKALITGAAVPGVGWAFLGATVLGELGKWYIYRSVSEAIKQARMAQAGADCVFWVRRQLEDTKKIVSRKEEAALRAYLLLQLHDGSKAVSIRDVRANSVPKDEPAYRELRKKWC